MSHRKAQREEHRYAIRWQVLAERGRKIGDHRTCAAAPEVDERIVSDCGPDLDRFSGGFDPHH